MIDTIKNNQKLLVTIVNKGQGSKVVKISKRAGCEGGTILFGKGTGVREASYFLGLKFDPEKEVIFSLINEDQADDVLNAISKAAKLGKPGNGVAFVLGIKAATGVAHLLDQQSSQS